MRTEDLSEPLINEYESTEVLYYTPFTNLCRKAFNMFRKKLLIDFRNELCFCHCHNEMELLENVSISG